MAFHPNLICTLPQFFCGPAVLSKQLHQMCNKYSNPGAGGTRFFFGKGMFSRAVFDARSLMSLFPPRLPRELLRCRSCMCIVLWVGSLSIVFTRWFTLNISVSTVSFYWDSPGIFSLLRCYNWPSASSLVCNSSPSSSGLSTSIDGLSRYVWVLYPTKLSQ